MPIVAMPDGTQVSFPDDMARDQIRSLILQKFPDAEKQASPKFGLGDTWPAQLAKSIYNAATLPGDVYQGNAAVPQSENMVGGENTQNIDRVTNLAAIASPVSPGSMFKTKMVQPTVPTPEELKSAAKSGYEAAKATGVELKPNAINDFVAKATGDLNADGINEVLAPKTFGVLDKMSSAPEGSSVTINDFRTMQRALGHAAKSPDPTEKLAASRALESLNAHIENIPQANVLRGTPDEVANASNIIKEANANYAAFKRGETVSGRLDIAKLNADAANSGQNIDNAIRQQIKGILKSPKMRSGYSAPELEQMRGIVSGTSLGNLARGAGNLLGGGGGLGAVASAGAGAYAAGPLGAVAPVAGYAMKKAGNALTNAQVSALENMIRMRSPLGQNRSPLYFQQQNPLAQLIASGQLTIPQVLGLGAIPQQ